MDLGPNADFFPGEPGLLGAFRDVRPDGSVIERWAVGPVDRWPVSRHAFRTSPGGAVRQFELVRYARPGPGGGEADRLAGRIVNVTSSDELYEPLVGQIRDDEVLLEQMWSDAEHRFEGLPGKVWTLVCVQEGERWVPVAWAAAAIRDGEDGMPVLWCSDNYERRGVARDWGLYALAYAHRHETVVEPCALPALTYLFKEPLALHEDDGWVRTGASGTSSEPGVEPHEWWELRREADRGLAGSDTEAGGSR